MSGGAGQSEGDGDRKGTIVVVDDEDHVRAALRHLLEGEGYVVVDEAGDARTALALAVMHEPAIVILDHHMSGRLGVDVIGDILSACPRTAVVVYTANDADAVRSQALEVGAAAVVDKAAGHDGLLQTLLALPSQPPS